MKQLRKLGAVILAAALTLSLSAVPAQANDFKSAAKQELTLLGAGYNGPALKDKSLEVRVGESKKIGLKNCSGLKVTYKSDDKTIATVSKKGKVKGKKEGRTYIYVTAKTKKGELRGRWNCRIDVKPALASKKTVNETIKAGKQLQLRLFATEENVEMEFAISTKSEDENLDLTIGVPENPNNYAQKVPVIDQITPDKKEATVKVKIKSKSSTRVIIWNNGNSPVDVTVKIKTADGKKTISSVQTSVL